MGTSSAGSVKVAADLFKTVGARGSSDTTHSHDSSDGALDACRSSNPDSTSPPGECRSPLRVELIPISLDKAPPSTTEQPAVTPAPEAAATPEARPEASSEKAPPPAAKADPCPEGYALIDGICKRAAEAARTCKPHDAADCKEQCTKGSAESCFSASVTSGLAPGEKAKLARKACDANIAEGCGVAAWSLHMDANAAREAMDSPHNVDAMNMGQKGCDAGGARACWYLGNLLDGRGYVGHDAKMLEASNRAYRRSCALGDVLGCQTIARRYANGDGGLKADPAMAVDLASRACASPDGLGCMQFAELLYSNALGPKQDKVRAAKVLTDYCATNPGLLCLLASSTSEIANDDEETFKLVSIACDHDDGACGKLGDLYARGTGVTKSAAKAKESYRKACKATADKAVCRQAKTGTPAPVKSSRPDPF